MPVQCLFTSFTSPADELRSHVEKLWKLDTLPVPSEKAVIRSRQDHQAMELLEQATERVQVGDVNRYATPLLRLANSPLLNIPQFAVMSRLCNTESRLFKDPDKAISYCDQISKLEQAGYVAKLTPEDVHSTKEAWYIPHHMVTHNNKDRIVFDCSFTFQGQCLNKYLLPGPILGPSLLGVLLRFRQHVVAISGDIKSMFHQILLLPQDRPLLRFLWRDMNKDVSPTVYQWQVLPFGTTCSPCCATYALQKHVKDNQTDEDVQYSVTQCFYVDNCLQSFPSAAAARTLLDKLRATLSGGGFDLRQAMTPL